jgi:hypothetical protein
MEHVSANDDRVKDPGDGGGYRCPGPLLQKICEVGRLLGNEELVAVYQRILNISFDLVVPWFEGLWERECLMGVVVAESFNVLGAEDNSWVNARPGQGDVIVVWRCEDALQSVRILALLFLHDCIVFYKAAPAGAESFLALVAVGACIEVDAWDDVIVNNYGIRIWLSCHQCKKNG